MQTVRTNNKYNNIQIISFESIKELGLLDKTNITKKVIKTYEKVTSYEAPFPSKIFSSKITFKGRTKTIPIHRQHDQRKKKSQRIYKKTKQKYLLLSLARLHDIRST